MAREKIAGIYPAENGYLTVIAAKKGTETYAEATGFASREELPGFLRSNRVRRVIGIVPSYEAGCFSGLIELPPVSPTPENIRRLVDFEAAQQTKEMIDPSWDAEVFGAEQDYTQGMLLVAAQKNAIQRNFCKGVKVVTPAVALPLLYQERGKEWPGKPPYSGGLQGVIAMNDQTTDIVIDRQGIPVWSSKIYFGSLDLELARENGIENENMQAFASTLSTLLQQAAAKDIQIPPSFDCPNKGELAGRIDEVIKQTETPIKVGYKYPYSRTMGAGIQEPYFYSAAAILAADVPIDLTLHKPGPWARAMTGALEKVRKKAQGAFEAMFSDRNRP